ncbi:MAG: hypothetical protein K0V04_43910 [Deltaproteobacteria bacterium]|nr:hypothetical protein [Deltaproteobacteria bacterium]
MGAPAVASLAAIAAGLARNRQIHVPSLGSNPLTLANVPGVAAMDPDERLHTLLLEGLDDLLLVESLPTAGTINVVVGWPDPQRPGSCPGLGNEALARMIGARIRRPVDPEQVRCMFGETAGARALAYAVARLDADPGIDGCLVIAADSLLTPAALRMVGAAAAWHRPEIVPGEGGAAVWVHRGPTTHEAVCVSGVGVTHLHGGVDDGSSLRAAIEHALGQAQVQLSNVVTVVADMGPAEASSLMLRAAMAELTDGCWVGDLHDPSSAIGDVGAAGGLIAIALGAHLLTRHGEGGQALCVTGRIDHRKVATVLSAMPRHANELEDMPCGV